MGCCLSTDASSRKDQILKKSPKSGKCGGASPLVPPLEEETVKEVLSETPIPKLPTPVVEKSGEVMKGLEKQDLKIESTAEVKRKESMAMTVTEPTEDIISEVSEHSELCSFTESFSTTTTATATAQEKRDDGEEVTQRSPMKHSRKRPNLGDTVRSRERNVRSPARRPLPSPEKRKPMASPNKPAQGRAMTVQRRNVGPPNGVRKDSGVGSARRSRSPVTRTEVGSRRNARYKSPGLGDTGRPRGRSPARAVENGCGPEKQRLQNENVVPENSEVEKQNDSVTQETSETLENPLVSLECFIFL